MSESIREKIIGLPRAAIGLVWINQRGVVHYQARKDALPVADLKALVSELAQAQAERDRYKAKAEAYEAMLDKSHTIEFSSGHRIYRIIRKCPDQGKWSDIASRRGGRNAYDSPLEAFQAIDAAAANDGQQEGKVDGN